MKEMIGVIVEAGPRLITAGITRITVGGVDVHLAAMVPAEALEREKSVARIRQPSDPLADPATYAGGHVPRFVDKLSPDGAEYPLPQARAGRRS